MSTREASNVDEVPNKLRSPRRVRQVQALLSLGLLAGFGAVSTLAAWTGGATATATIAAGTVGIGVGETGESASESYGLRIGGSDWYPGMSQAAVVSVRNTGTLDALYSVSGTITEIDSGKLGEGLAVTVTNGTVDGGATCNGDVVLQKAANGPFAPGITPPELEVGVDQTLCVQYSLPLTAPGTLQGNSTTVTLTFTATAGLN